MNRAIAVLLTILLAGCTQGPSDGSFLRTAWEHGTPAAALSSPLVADLDGDGDLEIASAMGLMAFVDHPEADRNLRDLFVLDHRGETLWTAEGGSLDASPTAFDWDGDGDMEIAIGLREAEGLAIYDGTQKANMALENWVHTPAAADINGDGATDLVVITGGSEGQLEHDHGQDHSEDSAFKPGKPGEIIALNRDLTTIWRHELGDESYSSPAIAATSSGQLIAHGLGGQLHFNGTMQVRSAATGEVVWQEATRTGVMSSPAATADAVFFVEWWGTVHARNITTGAAIWSAETNHIGWNSPALADLNADGILDVIVTGYRTPGLQFESFQLGVNDKASLGAGNGGIAAAYDGLTGDLLWRHEMEGAPTSPVAGDLTGDGVAEAVIVAIKGTRGIAGTDGGIVWVIDAGGNAVARHEIASGAIATPALANFGAKPSIIIATTGPAMVLRLDGQIKSDATTAWPQWRNSAAHTGFKE